MNIPILKELDRLKIAHATSKVNSATFQPDEKLQKTLIYQNTLRKEENKRRTEQKLKEADARLKSKEKITVAPDANVEGNANSEAIPVERPQTAPDFRLRSPSIKYSMQPDFSRPKTAAAFSDDKRNPFDNVLKTSTDHFRDDLQQHVHEQSKDSRRIFESLLHHFKGGGVTCQFSPKRDFEVIDINDILAARNSSHARSGTVKLEDISQMKKKDGIALFFDPTTDTGSTVITVRIYFQKAIDLVTEESCSRDYQFHSNGNYFGLELSSESSCKGGGGDRSPNSPSQYSPTDSPTPVRRMSPTSSPLSTVRKMGSPGGSLDMPRELINLVTFDQPSRADTLHNPHSGNKRSLPGWQNRPPIFIPSTRCSLEILHVDGVPADAATSYNLSKLRIFAVAAATSRAAVKKVHEFCHEFFVSHTANLVVAGGISALNMAALHGNLEGVKQLVQSGANINARSKESKNHTALHEAVVGGHKEVAKYLLQMGANQLLRDEIGFSPLHHACKLENIALARVLIESESGKRALLLHNNSDQKPIELCTSNFMKIRIEGAMRKLKIFVKPRVSILDR